MTFSEAIKTCLTQKYADFNGRASRSEYWYFVLFNSILSLISQLTADIPLVSMLFGIIGLVLMIPGIAVAVRRLHDVGKSGWWYLIAFTCVGVFYLIYLYIQEGTKGMNEYGDDPLNPTGESVELSKNDELGGDSVM